MSIAAKTATSLGRPAAFLMACCIAVTAATGAAATSGAAAGKGAAPGTGAAAAAGGEPAMSRRLTTSEIVAKNVAARGGLEAWRRIDTMMWVGHLETGNPAAPILPFVMELKRPNRTHFELHAEGQKSIRVFDGVQGWKRNSSARQDASLQPYTAEEVLSARDWQGFDGFLIDHVAKGIAVVLEGTDLLDGRTAYRVRVRLPSGSTRHVWLDAQTFLEVKYDREARTPAGQAGTVTVYLRAYQTISGLKIPMRIETGAGPTSPSQRMVIETVTLNPPLQAKIFARPEGKAARAVRAPLHTLLPPGWQTDRPEPGSAAAPRETGSSAPQGPWPVPAVPLPSGSAPAAPPAPAAGPQ